MRALKCKTIERIGGQTIGVVSETDLRRCAVIPQSDRKIFISLRSILPLFQVDEILQSGIFDRIAVYSLVVDTRISAAVNDVAEIFRRDAV